jgi:hypothetical protein
LVARQRILREVSADVKASANGTDEGSSLGHEGYFAMQIDGQRGPAFGHEGAADEMRCERDSQVGVLAGLGDAHAWAENVPSQVSGVSAEKVLGGVGGV